MAAASPGAKKQRWTRRTRLPIISSIRSTGCVPRSSACLPCTCGSTARTFAYGWTRKRSRGKKMGSMGFGRYLSFFYRRIFLSGKPSEDGIFSPFSNTFVYPSLSLISKKNPYDNTYEFLLLTMVTPKGFGPLNPALRGLWLKPLVDGAKKKAYLIYRFSLRLSRWKTRKNRTSYIIRISNPCKKVFV